MRTPTAPPSWQTSDPRANADERQQVGEVTMNCKTLSDASTSVAKRQARRLRLAFLFLTSIALFLTACGSQTTTTRREEPTPPSEKPPEPAVSEWLSVDIGSSFVGDTVAEDGSLVVVASGVDVWSTSDSFRFIYHPLSGDGSLTVRVDDMSAPNEWTKVGVMVREDLGAAARNAFLLLTDFNGVLFQRREVVGGVTDDVLPDGTYMRDYVALAPWWLRLERQGDLLVAWHSQDGREWRELGRVTLAMPDDVFIGMAVTSRDPDAVAKAIFSNVALTQDDNDNTLTPTPNPTPVVPITGPTVSASFSRSDEVFPNPERGWQGSSDSRGYAGIRAAGYTLVRQYVRLDDYRTSALPQSLLNNLASELAALRQNGLKIVLRFSYNFGEQPDAPLNYVLQHIQQLTPVVREYSDVIAVLQGGFIGAWGEWHSSTNNLLTLQSRTAITNALLDMLPESRMMEIRYPYRASDMFPTPVNASNAFDGSDVSRVGQVNDCFLTDQGDGGTYTSQADRDYVAAVTTYTVMGGETCALGGLNSRNDGGNAVAELERYHWDYLGRDFWTPVIDKWVSQGYYDEISRRLGYRYVMLDAQAQASVTAGQTYSLNINMRNEGFGKLYNPRPLNIVLKPRNGGAAITLRAYDDARTVLPLAGETRAIPITVRLPSNIASGTYDVHVALPDAAANLANDNRYAIRIANTNTWSTSDGGTNSLNLTLNIP